MGCVWCHEKVCVLNETVPVVLLAASTMRRGRLSLCLRMSHLFGDGWGFTSSYQGALAPLVYDGVRHCVLRSALSYYGQITVSRQAVLLPRLKVSSIMVMLVLNRYWHEYRDGCILGLK